MRVKGYRDHSGSRRPLLSESHMVRLRDGPVSLASSSGAVVSLSSLSRDASRSSTKPAESSGPLTHPAVCPFSRSPLLRNRVGPVALLEIDAHPRRLHPRSRLYDQKMVGKLPHRLSAVIRNFFRRINSCIWDSLMSLMLHTGNSRVHLRQSTIGG